MSLSALYQEVIMDHGRHPRRFHAMPAADCIKHGHNPLCGDELVVYLKLEGDIVKDVSFQGSGCAISMASASLMAEAIVGKRIAEVEQLFTAFHGVITADGKSQPTVDLAKLEALRGVAEYPARVKCATLAWHTVMAGLQGQAGDVTTE